MWLCTILSTHGVLIIWFSLQEAIDTLYGDTELYGDEFAVVIQPFFIGVDVPRVSINSPTCVEAKKLPVHSLNTSIIPA